MTLEEAETAARKLLDIHLGRGASKPELHAHILAYELIVPALLAALEAQRAAVRLEWEPHNNGYNDGYKLVIHVGKLSFGILSANEQEDGWEVVIRLTHYTWLSAEKAAALVADHIATLDLPCPLPAFPGLVQQ